MKIPNHLKDHACSCDKCKNMCKKTPCLGTPEDMLRIAKAGFADKIFKTAWYAGLVQGTHTAPVTIIAPLMTDKGCVFQDDNGLCTLHDLGLKPTEGRISSSHQVRVYDDIEKFKNENPTWLVISEWEKRDYKNIERRIYRDEKP